MQKEKVFVDKFFYSEEIEKLKKADKGKKADKQKEKPKEVKKNG